MPLPSCSPNALSLVSAPTTLGQLHGCHQIHRTVPGRAGRHHQSMALCGYYRQRHSPLDQQRDNTNLTMTQVDAYNAALVTMCEEDGYKFLNTAEVLRDDATGWAKRTIPFRTGCIFPKRLSLPILLMCAPTLMSRRTAAPKAQPPSRSRTAYRWG